MTRFGMSMRSLTAPGAEAALLEALGFDYATCGEHISFHGPMASAFVSLAAAAASTTQIKLLTTVALAPLYPPPMLAKLGAALDVASAGRFELGVGVGGENPAEFEACGVPVRERGARVDECLQVVRQLWSEDCPTSFDGRFSRFHDLAINPRPVQRPTPPIWVSGRSDAAMRRAARFRAGWLPYMYTPEMLAASLERIRSLGGDGDKGGLFVWTMVDPDERLARRVAQRALAETYRQEFDALLDKYCAVGTPVQVVRRLQEFIDAGAETVVLSVACPQDDASALHRRFAEDVLPELRL